MQRDETTLLDIAEAARLIDLFLGDLSAQEFLEDPKTQYPFYTSCW